MRLTPGENGTWAFAVAKIEKVGVSPALIVAWALMLVDVRHAAVNGLVWQMAMVSGRVADPVLAVAVIAPPDPTLTLATANAPEPVAPVIPIGSDYNPYAHCRIPMDMMRHG
jgi:hypothetical protein